MAEATVCYPTPLSMYGIKMQESAWYMGIATAGASWYYTTTPDLQQKAVSALAAGAVAAIAANIVGWAAKSYLAKCQ